MAQLWDGADVRWCGPERARVAAGVAEDERLTVIDAGRHHVSSFATLRAGHQGGGRLILVRRADGGEVDVDPGHVELVAPAHPLRPEADGAQARWWRDQLDDWDRALTVGAFVPRALPAVGVVLHPWSKDGTDVRWETVADELGMPDRAAVAQLLEDIEVGQTDPPDPFTKPEVGRMSVGLASTLVDVLTGATTTPDDVVVAVWEGWGDTPPSRFPGAAHVGIGWRDHFLLRGPLSGVRTSVSAIPSHRTGASGVWWPADRAWLVHTEIDFHWTFVAGSSRLIDVLVDDQRVECVRTHHDAPANTLGS